MNPLKRGTFYFLKQSTTQDQFQKNRRKTVKNSVIHTLMSKGICFLFAYCDRLNKILLQSQWTFNHGELRRFLDRLNPERKLLLNAWIDFVSDNAQSSSNSLISLTRFILAKMYTGVTIGKFIETFVDDIVTPAFSTDRGLQVTVKSHLNAALASKSKLSSKKTITNIFSLISGGQKKSASSEITSSYFKPGINEEFYDALKPDIVSADEMVTPANAPVIVGGHTSINDYESISTNVAGLGLLAPYLQRFFKDLGLINNDAFINHEKQCKAVQILHYVATSERRTPEHMLTLNKLLVGLDINTPIPARLSLTKRQKAVCELLLTSVITNWPALGNTSVKGLQGSFLLRNGVIRKDGDNWILHVEHKTFDVLLDKLPWSFRLIKLSWNEYFIHVQW
jgi:hypothetical protein